MVAAALFVHPAGGLALAASALVGALLAAATAPAARRALVPVALSLAGGVMVAAPYVRAISGSGGGVGLDWGLAADRRGLVSAIVAGAFLLPWAAWQLAARRPREPGATALAGMLAGLVVPACLLRFPGDNQSKLLDLALLLAAAPAALAWAQLASAPARRVLVRGGLVVAFAPTLAAALWAYAHERETSADAPSRPPAGLVSAVRAFVPPAAWLVDATLDTTRGAAPALPGETGRALVWSGGFMARKWGYADSLLSQRRAAAESLARGQWPPADGGRWLRALDPELWLIAPDDSTRATTFDEHVVARARGVKLARISGLL